MLPFLLNHWEQIISVISLAVGIYGIWGMQTAKAATRSARRKLLQIMAAKDFDELVQASSLLTSSLTAGNHDHCRKLAIVLTKTLSAASGAWTSLFTGPDKDKIDVAIMFARNLSVSLATDQQPLEQESVRRMVNASEFIGSVAAEVSGRLKYAFQAEEEQ